MANYSYVAVDPQGGERRGVLDVATQTEAVRRVREMGLFPTKIRADSEPRSRGRVPNWADRKRSTDGLSRRSSRRVDSGKLVTFTRQLATLLGAGMPLVRGLRILAEQAEGRRFQKVISQISSEIENGASFSEALASHPRIFNKLYVNLVKAGEAAGALEITLGRLADFMEKAQKLRSKLISAMFYPAAVVFVASGVLALLMIFIVPRFQRVFEGLMEGVPLPAFTRLIFGLSNAMVHQLPWLSLSLVLAIIGGFALVKTRVGSRLFDKLKLSIPLLGPLFRKAAISRFARTLGTLAGNGVPILQALTIVKDTAGNFIVGQVIERIYDHVKQGDAIAPILKASGVFPPMVAGMVDVGEQTGALPEMLMKVADTYDEEFDNTAKGLTSLLEPILIVFLAIIVGSIVIAMFLPLVVMVTNFGGGAQGSM